MKLETAPAPVAPEVDDQGPDHLICCDNDVAYCGEDVADAEEVPVVQPDGLCPLCETLIGTTCPRCGEPR